VGGQIDQLLRVQSVAGFDEPALYEFLQHDDCLVLGGGSNVLFVRPPRRAVRIEHTYLTCEHEDAAHVVLRVGGGTPWPELVEECTGRGWFGLENLALIPGTAGAAPIQNIGAYGVELVDVLEAVVVRERATGAEVRLSAAACGLGYRTSRFKTEWRGRYLIESIVLRLHKQARVNVSYAALAQALPEAATPAEVFAAVCRIRRSKLPDPAQVGNAGSFFQNPVVGADVAEALRRTWPDLVAYPQPDGQVKLAAGWLIDRCGWRGHRQGDTGTWPAQALVLVNYGEATGAHIWQLAQDIRAAVADRFGIRLEPEVQVLA
jgi:UDP-N-acetylmuramate dehydrogenase